MLSDNQVLNSLLTADPSALPNPEPVQAGLPAEPKVAQGQAAKTITTTFSSPSPEEVIKLSTLGGYWSEENSIASASFSFTKLSKATRFLYSVLAEACGNDYEGISLDLSTESSNWNVNLRLGLTDGTLSDKDLLIGQFASYAYTKIIAGGSRYYDDYYSEPKLDGDAKETLREPMTESTTDYSWVQTLSDNTVGVDAEKRLIKVPFAVLGSWKHPVYKQVTFTQKDFDEMQQNFSTAVLGFEPPLFLGHPVDTSTTEGHPAEAFLQSLVQEGDVLYGLFEAVNDVTYANVALGRYRYSSGEFVRNYPSKEDGRSVGTVLMGVALTNRPFLPGLPHVKALSEPTQGLGEQMSCVFKLSTPQPMTTSTSTAVPAETATPSPESPKLEAMSQPTQNQTAVIPQAPVQQFSDAVNSEQFRQFKDQVLSEVKEMQDAHTAQLTAYNQQLSETKQALSVVQQENEHLKAQVQASEDRYKQAQIDGRLSELNNLSLPQEVKEKYSELFKNGALGDQEETIMATLRDMSAARVEAATTQHGVTTTTKALNSEEFEDPYAETIRRNQELAEQRVKNLQTLLS